MAIPDNYSKPHNKFLFPPLAAAIYGNACKAEHEISNVVNYNSINVELEMEAAVLTGFLFCVSMSMAGEEIHLKKDGSTEAIEKAETQVSAFKRSWRDSNPRAPEG
ncbi:MAG: hypothetical protein K2P41_12285 [Lachnospiraceae bacterium]|nr:hypothetical protein [Lachnospiraceae bacterium]